MLGNLSSDNKIFRDIILKENAIELLIHVIDKFKNNLVVKFSAWTLSNLCRMHPFPPFDKVRRAIEKLAEVLSLGLI